MTRLRTVARVLDERFEEVIACGCLVMIAVCVFIQVVLRYVFNTGLSWTEELAGFCMAWAVYMGAALGVRERFHIRIMFGVRALPRKFALGTVFVGDLLWAWFNLFMIWFGLEYVALLWRTTHISPGLEIDEKWPQSIVVIGYCLIMARLVQVYVRWFRDGRQGLPGVLAETGEPLE